MYSIKSCPCSSRHKRIIVNLSFAYFLLLTPQICGPDGCMFEDAIDRTTSSPIGTNRAETRLPMLPPYFANAWACSKPRLALALPCAFAATFAADDTVLLV